MKTFIALFRGINVGGHNKLPMRELVEVLEGLNYHKIRTYIQSGNVVFESERTDRTEIRVNIRDAITRSHGFSPEVFLLQPDEMQDAIQSNPYRLAENEPKSLHLFFLDSEPQNPNLDKLNAMKGENESFTLTGRLFYLYTPDGIGRSKLAAGAEKALGVATTARNWRSVCEIMALATS